MSSYPVQSPPEPAVAAAAPDEKLQEGPPQLPRNIRAVQDGKNFRSEGRTIVICLDGTGDQFDADNSNIVHLVSCLKKSSPEQITYYQSGIGTYDGGGLSNGFHAAMDMAVGSGLGVHIRDAYKFLMQTYRENDKICLFGFSRGAYTARCLSGMIHKVGLLPAHNTAQVPFAYQFYKDDSPNGWKMSAEFKRTFCVDISVYFIGVFDSVASVGLIPRRLPLSSTPTNKATYFRHAMALDEHRAKFKACRFQSKDAIGPQATWHTIAEAHEQTGPVRRFSSNLGVGDEKLQSNGNADAAKLAKAEGADKDEKEKEEVNEEYTYKLKGPSKRNVNDKPTDVLEVWFAGCHCDVGGGAVANEERHKLAQIPLRWMIRQAFECDTGIIFKAHALAEEGIDIHTLYPVYTRLEKPSIEPPPSMKEKHAKGELPALAHRSTVLEPVNEDEPHGLHSIKLWADPEKQQLAQEWVPEQVEDYFDSISTINDQLAASKTWWILEFWPIKVRVQPKNTDDWVKKVAFNRGRFRPVQEFSPNLHWTVQQRMSVTDYKIRTRLDRKAIWNVVV